MRARWVLKEAGASPLPEDDGGMPPLFRRILAVRGLAGRDEVGRHMGPPEAEIHDPFLLRDMDAAVDRISTAIAGREKILIFGDYDVDGMTSVAWLSRYLRSLGADPMVRVPHRIADGYGITAAGVDRAAASGVKLLITVDCGTSAFAACERAAHHGIDLIVADHHQPDPDLPPAFALVNPWRRDSAYPSPDLCAVGVVTKLGQALALRLGSAGGNPSELFDLTAIGTVADSVSLTGENRAFVRLGLDSIRRRPRPAIAALLETAGLESARFGAGEIAYQIAPRLNAAGRLGDPQTALDLLLSDDLSHCRRRAIELEQLNLERRRLLDRVVRDAEERVIREGGSADAAPMIALASPDWHPGVLGIAASRLVERFGVPAILMGIEGGIVRGSGRTCGEIDLLEWMRPCSGGLRSFGGHRAAIGMTLQEEDLRDFLGRLTEHARRLPPAPDSGSRTLTIDARAELSEITRDLLEWLDRLEPFGIGNEEPVVAVKGRLAGYPRVLKQKHLRFDITDGTTRRECIAFQMGERAGAIESFDGEIHVAARVTRNLFRGEERLQLQVRDLAIDDPF